MTDSDVDSELFDDNTTKFMPAEEIETNPPDLAATKPVMPGQAGDISRGSPPVVGGGNPLPGQALQTPPASATNTNTGSEPPAPSFGGGGTVATPHGEDNGPDSTESLRRLGDFGPYQILSFLAKGGMGAVFRGQHKHTGEIVALKIPSQRRISDPDELRRFLREARLNQKLRHPNICRMIAVGEVAGRPYIAMEYIHGLGLRDWLPHRKPTLLDVARLTARLARAADYAHQNGIIHRDIKPENIMVDANDEPILLDFGLAREPTDDSSLTKSGICVGTPTYMSPEQAFGGGAPSPQTDVYGLGALLYELLTGHPPYLGRPAEVLLSLYQGPPRSPRELNPSLPEPLETICLTAMQRDLNRRYARAADIATALEAIVAEVAGDQPPNRMEGASALEPLAGISAGQSFGQPSPSDTFGRPAAEAARGRARTDGSEMPKRPAPLGLASLATQNQAARISSSALTLVRRPPPVSQEPLAAGTPQLTDSTTLQCLALGVGLGIIIGALAMWMILR